MSVRSYSSKEQVIFVWFMMPYTLMINLLIFGSSIFNSFTAFLQTFCISLIYFALIYMLFGVVARIIKMRYPDDSLLFKRISIMLPVFYILNLLMLQALYLFYELLNAQNCIPRRSMEWWATGFACVISTVITLINEAAVGWDNWKNSVRETEQIKNAYQKTKLLGLKGQVNPHFLFNCFNSLSSLINEDAAKAEKFLDEMTKVHRYMLRSDDEQLTSLKDEVSFTNSYLYLIKERFGEAISVSLNIQSDHLMLLLPPLSMQTILENIIYNNTASKATPLLIDIEATDSVLKIKHSLHLKTRGNTSVEEEEGLDNLIKKYELFNNEKMLIREFEKNRWIILPLLSSKKEVVI
jgi:two-component system LytT family sensor kinase